MIRYRSAAPFIAKKLVQYHGISNPSPGFVLRVTKAFQSGVFVEDGVTFGDGSYGNLKAVAAAVSLDPESTSPVVDEDPFSGNIREPLLKLIQFMRSLDFRRRPRVKFRHGLFEDMSFKIGQIVFDPPDQFSFFATDYAPSGMFAELGMVSPEAELLSMNAVVGFANGIHSFVNYGLSNADSGFGPRLGKLVPVGDVSASAGVLTYEYRATHDLSVARDVYASSVVSEKIDQLSTLLTAGRLGTANKQVLVNAHAYFTENYGVEFADRAMLKLVAATPEFHTTSIVRKTGMRGQLRTSSRRRSPRLAVTLLIRSSVTPKFCRATMTSVVTLS